jgi:hypothetical protein
MFYYTEWNQENTYFKSIGTLSQTFKNHIHNNNEIQDQYPREHNLTN